MPDIKYVRLSIIVLIALICSLAGCSSRYVNFTSDPSGAKITVGNITATTPCRLKIPQNVRKVDLILPNGQIKSATIPRRDAIDEASEELGKSGAILSKSISYMFATVGIAGFIVLELTDEDATIDYPDRKEDSLLAMYATIAGAAGWYIFNEAGNNLEAAATSERDVHVDFEESTTPEPAATSERDVRLGSEESTTPSEGKDKSYIILDRLKTKQYDLNYKPDKEIK